MKRKLLLAHPMVTQPGECPYRVIDEQSHEIAWVNNFLDAQQIRQLSPRSLRAYAYDLLPFARWWHREPQTLSAITESTLLDYVRHQLNQHPKPTPQTVNHRLTVIRCLYRFHHGQEIPASQSHFQRIYTTRCPSAMAAPIAPWPLASGSSNLDTSSGLCRQSRWLSFGPAFVPSATLPWWA
jgi:hypothetical protein